MRSLIPCILLLAAAPAFAKPVGIDVARRVAVAQYRTASPVDPMQAMLASESFPLVYQQRSAVAAADTQSIYYVFNTPDAHGFVVVAGDDAVEPILAYSTESSFSLDRPSPEFLWWMHRYERQIVAVIARNQAASERTQRMWMKLGAAAPPALLPLPVQSSVTVGPLVTTQWDQAPYYNDLCPFDPVANDRAVTGCVATAFAQIMRYHRSPEHGNGDHGYSHQLYGYLYANFANATYDWNSMPERLTGPNQQVAQLMYHMGVSCDMGYGTAASGGSGADPKVAAAALVRYFGYQSSVRDVERSDYDDNTWMNMIRAELDNSRPVEYHGFGDGSGHSFVCDGYNGAYFHMNWGWDGQFNGFFLLSNLEPGGVGAGGGNGAYNNDQGAVIGIVPDHPTPGEATLEMNADLSVDPNPATTNSVVTVSFDLHNTGTSDFQGDYCVALFDENGTFVKYLGGVWTNMQLHANNHYVNGLTHKDTLFGVYPGTYYTAVYARPTGKEWELVSGGSYQNSVTLEVTTATYPSELAIYVQPAVAPSQIHVGETFTVHTDFANISSDDFQGDIGLWAYTIDGGRLVGEIQVLQGLSLSANSHWVNGQTFTCSGLNVKPGRYLLAFFSRLTGDDWQVVNPGDYVNPMIVDVLPSVLGPDRYEPNDASSSAYRLSMNYSGNVGIVTTAGANIHASGNDDYYRIDLPEGYDYDITGILHDSWTDDPDTYTNVVSVMVNAGDGWSAVYEDSTDVMHVPGGRSVLFKVQALYLGSLGTYQLDIRATRQVSGVNGPAASPGAELSVYPVPATNELNVQLASGLGHDVSLRLVDAGGRTVAERTGIVAGTDPVRFSLAGVPSGAYFLVAETGHGRFTRPVVVRR
ncbi:MAG: thiol protease/hemagglutinin PrtT [Bacteroidetes bacterium]|nr:thiol protease/hemagglutinin PrtT [Bacteroidota bacterium]